MAKTTLLWSGVAVAVLYSTGNILQPRAELGGTTLIARHVLVVRDISGSMAGTEALLAAHIDKLRAAGMTLREQTAWGFGAAVGGASPQNFRNRLELALQESVSVDAVYLFSDYNNIDFNIDGNDEAGYAVLRQLLARHRLRLYLGTVREAPPPKMVAIARQSGGGLIGSQ